MRSSLLIANIACVVAFSGLTLLPGPAGAEPPANPSLRDDFQSKLALDWEVIRPDPAHVSLDTHPGKLTITTQYGSIHQAQTTARNLHLIVPPENVADFVVTTCIEDFLPETEWQQAGLLFYDDDDNFFKWVRDYTSRGYPVLNAQREISQQVKGIIAPVAIGKERFWLRVIKRGDLYQCQASLDGQAFTTYAVVAWGNGSPRRVGLVAKNGPREDNQEAQFDFFELRGLTDAERNDPTFLVRRSLLGKWNCVERRINGKIITEGTAPRMLVEPGTLTLQEDRKLIVSFTIDPASTPGRITFIPRDHGVGPLLHGVYSLDGDSLTLCLNPKLNGEAPASLQTSEGDGYLLMKLERIEP